MGDIVITPASNDVNSTAGTLTVRTSDSQPISIKTNDVNRLYVTSAGNVGINTISPVEKLQVSGNAIIGHDAYNSSYGQYLRFPFGAGDLTTGTLRAYLQFDSVQDYSVNAGDAWKWKLGTVARAGNAGNYNSQFEILRSTRVGVTDNTDFAISRDGCVGIGTVLPSGGLHINNAQGAFSEVIRLQRNGGVFYSVGLDTNFLNIAYNGNTNGSNIFVLRNNGFLGLGNLQTALFNLDIASTQAQGIQLRYDATTGYRAQITPYWNSTADTRIDFAINRAANLVADVIMSVGYNSNVGIGTTRPSALLDLYSSASRIRFNRGSSYNMSFGMHDATYSALSIKNSSDTSTIAYFQYDGSVGIGTTAPTSLLQMVGANPFFRISNSGANGDQGIKISYGNYDTAGLHLLYNPNAAIAYIDNTYPSTPTLAWGDIQFRQNIGNGTLATRILIQNQSSGRVGISNNSPLSLLSIGGAGSTAPASGITLGGDAVANLYRSAASTLKTDAQLVAGGGFYTTSTSNFMESLSIGTLINIEGGPNEGLFLGDTLRWYIGTTDKTYTVNADGDLHFRDSTNSITRMIIQYANGHVGIGSTDPAYRLDVYDTNKNIGRFYNNQTSLEFFLGSTNNTLYTDLLLVTSNSNAQIFKNRSNVGWGGVDSLNIYTSLGPIAFHPSGVVNALYLNEVGNVGISTSNPNYKLDVAGAIAMHDEAQDIDARYYGGTFLRGWSSFSYGTEASITYTTDTTCPVGIEVISVSTFVWARGPKIRLDKTQNYEIEVWVKRQTANTGGEFYLVVSNYSSDGSILTGDGTDWHYPASSNPPSSSWTKYTAIVGPYGGSKDHSANARYISVGFIANYTTGTDVVYMTGFKCRPIPKYNNNNLTLFNDGRVGIGTTQPTGVLHLHGNTNSWLTSPSIVMSSSSTVAANIRNWRVGPADTNYGNFHIGVSDVRGGVVDSNAEAQAFTITYDQKVGIGLTNPSYPLHVANTIVYHIVAEQTKTDTSDTSAYATFFVINKAGTSQINGYFGAGGAGVGNGSMQNHVYIGAQSNHGFRLFTNDTAKVTVQTDGNVGIGTTAPAGLLHVYSIAGRYINFTPSSVSGLLVQRNASVGSQGTTVLTLVNAQGPESLVDRGTSLNLDIGYGGNSTATAGTIARGARIAALNHNAYDATAANQNAYLVFYTATGGSLTEKVRIQADNKVGIGVGNPVSLLTVGGAGSTSVASGITFGADASANLYRDSSASIRTDGGFLAASRIRSLDYIQFNSNLYPNAYTNPIDINIGNIASNAWQSAIRINPGGYVGIGTTQPSGKLHVVSTIAGETVLRADGTNGTLFSVVDDLSDSLMSVNNSAGLPVLEVFADDRIVAGQYGSGDFIVTNNKVGIGTTNPLNKLTVIGNASIGSTTYNFSAPANGLIVQGNVGLGTTNPQYKLDVGAAGNDVISVRLTPGYERVRYYGFDLLGYNDGNLWMIGNNNSNSLILSRSWDWDYQVAFTYTPGSIGIAGGILQIGQANKNNANYTHGITTLFTSGLERVRVNSVGNVGIGTNSPASKLHVKSSTAQDGIMIDSATYSEVAYRINGSATKSYLSLTSIAGGYVVGSSANSFIIRNDSDIFMTADAGVTSNITIKNDGKVGIGITNPSRRLHIDGGNTTTVGIYLDATGIAGTDLEQSIDAFRFQVRDSVPAIFYTNNTERMRISNDGNVGIGNVAPNGARVHIKGDGSIPVLRVETALIESPAGGTAGRTLKGWLPIMTGVNAADKVYIPLYGALP